MTHKKLCEISRTKTVATVGPACATVDGLADLITRGANVFRLNMAHGSRTDHEQAIVNIRKASEQTEIPAGILIDLAGPKIRLGSLAQDPLVVENSQHISFVRGVDSEKIDELTCTYEQLIDEVKIGHEIVLADGIIRLRVEEKLADRVRCVVEDGGTLRSRQGVNLPATHLSVPALGDKDRDNAVWAAGQGIDFVSLSFVRNAEEIIELKQLLGSHDCQATVIAKIEKREALENLESIIQASDGIMVARGDLGVEIEIYKTPLAQKRIIKTCMQFKKPVIVATQMLESMHTSKQPTRAEASDVANAILDGADACMLSGETAIGEYPGDAVSMMQHIMLETEEMFRGRSSRMSARDCPVELQVTESVMYGSAQIARRLDAKVVVIGSSTGATALLKSKQRDYIPTVCMTDRKEVLRRMCLYWGIVPVEVDDLVERVQFREFVNNWAKTIGQAKVGDPLVMVTDTEWMPNMHDTVMVGRVS